AGREAPPGRLRVSTRRGRQFNSMRWGARDPLTGAARDEVLMSAEDCARLGLAAGDGVRLRSESGVLDGRVRIAPIRPGNLEVHWPEGNALIPRGTCDRRSGEPDYNAWVEVVPWPPSGEEAAGEAVRVAAGSATAPAPRTVAAPRAGRAQ